MEKARQKMLERMPTRKLLASIKKDLRETIKNGRSRKTNKK
jgi:hypothetical protein